MTNFKFCRDSIHSKTTESCLLLFLCTLAKTERSACARGFSCHSLTQEHVLSSSSRRAERRVLVLLNMEAPPAQLREESFRGPTSLKTASVIAVMPMESLLILRRQVGKHQKKLLKFDRTICTTTWHHVLTKVALEATTVRSTKSKLTRRFWSRVTVSRPSWSYSLIMICGEDDEDASDKNTDAIGLELEQGQRSRSVPQWAAHYRSSKNE